MVLVVRLAVYVASADDHSTYEALGVAQLFGLAGIVLLVPLVLTALAGSTSALLQRRAAFVCNVVVGMPGILVTRGLGSLGFLVVVPITAVALRIVGLVRRPR